MTPPIKQSSFSGGEVAPFLYARTDQIKYETGLRTMRNFIAMRHGGATNRPGTQYVGTTQNGGAAVRLMPFIFNETGNGQSYVLEFGNQYVAFYQNGGVVSDGSSNTFPLFDSLKTYNVNDVVVSPFGFHYIGILPNNVGHTPNISPTYWALLNDWNVGAAYNAGDYVRGSPTGGGNYFVCLTPNTGFDPLVTTYPYWRLVETNYLPYKISSPYLQVDLQNLKFAETADIITIVHPSYPPYELKRLGAASFTLTQIVFGTTQANPTNFVAVTLPPVAAANATYSYKVSAVNANGDESVPTNAIQVGPGRALPAIDGPFSMTWDVTTGASFYKVYFSFTTGTGAYGFLGTVSAASFTDTGLTPDFTNAPPIANSLFGSTNNYPSTVGFVQQRRCFANTNNNPLGFFMSQPGLFANFNTHLIPSDSDAIIGSIAGQEVNAIQNILELKFMLMLTSGAEIYVQGNGSGVVTPTSINASTQSQYGAGNIRPLRVSDTIVFSQSLGSFIRDFGFDFAINGYRGNDLTVFSSHMFEGFSVVDWDYQKIPDSILWAVRDDGTLLGLTYMREQQVLAWHRHDFENGIVENVCCIPENGNYAVYLSIKRTINGSTVRYIERLSSRIWTDVLNATYLDCFLKYNGVNTEATTVGLTSPTGSFTNDGTAYKQQLTLTSSLPFFASYMVGDQIFISSVDFQNSRGNMVDPENDSSSLSLPEAGEQIRCTIVAYVSSTVVTVTPNKIVPSSLQNVTTVNWARAVKTLTGLSHLAGQEVSVWADRFLVASPNNEQVKFTVVVGLDGSVTLDKCYAVIYVGLPMTSDLETLDIETSFGETIISRRKRQNVLRVHLYNTRTLFAGSENPDVNPDNTNDDPLFQLEELKTGLYRDTYDIPPLLVTEQESIIEESRWNKNGRIFIRNVDPVPLTILAVVPAGDNPAPYPQATRV